MVVVTPPIGPGLKALHDARDSAAEEIARAIQRVLPTGFTGKFTVTASRGVVRPENVSVELRPPQRERD